MAHFVDVNQLAEVCKELGLTKEVDALEKAAAAAGGALAKKLRIEVVSEADNQPGFGGLCVGFGPLFDGQKIPEVIADCDKSSDWVSQ